MGWACGDWYSCCLLLHVHHILLWWKCDITLIYRSACMTCSPWNGACCRFLELSRGQGCFNTKEFIRRLNSSPYFILPLANHEQLQVKCWRLLLVHFEIRDWEWWSWMIRPVHVLWSLTLDIFKYTRWMALKGCCLRLKLGSLLTNLFLSL